MFVLLVALLFVGLSFLIHLLWIVALVFCLFWVAGWALGRGERAGRGERRRWYGRW